MNKPVENGSSPHLRIRTGSQKYDMALSRALSRLLNHAPYVKLFWNEDEQVLFIAPSDTPKNSYPTPGRHYAAGKEEIISDKTFIKALCKKVGWAENAVYTIKGEYEPELSMTAFRLKDAVKKG